MRAGCSTFALLVLLGVALPARAEPYLALRTGLKCSGCHVNATGGGGRTAYGAGYGRKSLAWSKTANWPDAFDGSIGERLRIGTDLRAAYEVSFRKEERNLEEFVLSAAQLYAAVDIVPERVSVYVDERVAPGGALNREAFVMLRPGKAGLWFKAGRFFPAHGWRLQDDEAAIRKYTGFNFDSPDTGFEVGVEPGPWSLMASLTNGSGGGAETNNGKQFVMSGAFVRSKWRAGISASANDLPADARRRTAALFAGLHGGPITALAEWDLLRDEAAGGGATVDGETSHVELDWLVLSGLTLRAWAGRYDPDRDVAGDTLDQLGLGADWTFAPGVQLRLFYRDRSGPVAVAGSRDGQGVLELHAYF